MNAIQITKENIDSIGGIRGDVLLELESSSFTRNMVMYKIMQASSHL